MVHSLKTWSDYFQAIRQGRKTFEIRQNDRNFAVGDWLHLKEYNHREQRFTGDAVLVMVSYITDWEQKPGYVVMGFREVNDGRIEGAERETSVPNVPHQPRADET